MATIQQVHNRFRLLYDSFNNAYYPNLEPQEIDDIINITLREFVKTRYGGNNLYRTGVEETQKRTDDLRTLTSGAVLTKLSPAPSELSHYLNKDVYELPSNYWFLLNIQGDATFINNCGQVQTFYTDFKVIDHDFAGFDSASYDPFNRPEKFYVNVVFSGNYIVVLREETTSTNNVRINYLRQPLDVNISTNQTIELPEHTHDEIISLAVQKALEIAESQRVATHPSEVAKIE